jgi:hypothetical protein
LEPSPLFGGKVTQVLFLKGSAVAEPEQGREPVKGNSGGEDAVVVEILDISESQILYTPWLLPLVQHKQGKIQ